MTAPLIIINTDKAFEDAVVSVLKAVDKQGWTVFQIYDLRERLAAKGFEHLSLKVIEICSAKHSDRILRKNRLASLCMPCRINVIQGEEQVQIAAVKPAMMIDIFENIKNEDIQETEAELLSIISHAK